MSENWSDDNEKTELLSIPGTGGIIVKEINSVDMSNLKNIEKTEYITKI